MLANTVVIIIYVFLQYVFRHLLFRYVNFPLLPHLGWIVVGIGDATVTYIHTYIQISYEYS